MTLQQLEYIVAVRQTGTMLAAAEKLNVSHPSIGKAISALEDELNVCLFERTPKGTRSTPNGEIVLAHAQRILEEMTQMRADIRKQTEKQTVTIQAFPLDSMFFLPDILGQMRQRFPHTSIYIRESSLSNIVSAVKEQKTDFGIVALPKRQIQALDAELRAVTLLEERLVLACSPRHPFAQKKAVTLDELTQCSLVLHDDDLIAEVLRLLFEGRNLRDILIYSNNNTLIKQMVEGGGGGQPLHDSAQPDRSVSQKRGHPADSTAWGGSSG